MWWDIVYDSMKRPILGQNKKTEMVLQPHCIQMTQCQLLTATFELLPYQTILKEMNGLSHIEKPLITTCIRCHPHSRSLLSLCPSSFPLLIFHSPCSISFTPLFLSPSVYYDAFSLSLPPPCSVLPSFPPFQRWTVFLSFHYSLPILASPAHAHTPVFKIPLSFWLSSSAVLVCSSCFSLSVFSKNSINQRLLGFFTYSYLWCCCSYHFPAPDKCTEYST